MWHTSPSPASLPSPLRPTVLLPRPVYLPLPAPTSRRHPRRLARINLSCHRANLLPPPTTSSRCHTFSHPSCPPLADSTTLVCLPSTARCRALPTSSCHLYIHAAASTYLDTAGSFLTHLPPPHPLHPLHAAAHCRRRLEGWLPAAGRPDPNGRGADLAGDARSGGGASPSSPWSILPSTLLLLSSEPAARPSRPGSIPTPSRRS